MGVPGVGSCDQKRSQNVLDNYMRAFSHGWSIVIFQVFLALSFHGRRAQTAGTLTKFVEHYKSFHNAKRIQEEPADLICARRYLVARMQCQQFGNYMHNFVNSFILALVSNRTLILTGGADCHKSIKFSNWILRSTSIGLPAMNNSEHMREFDCGKLGNSSFIKSLSTGWLPEKRAHAMKVIACSNIDAINDMIVEFGPFLDHHQAIALNQSGALLGTSARLTINKIFGQYDEYAIYGYLIRHVFEFSRDITDWNRNKVTRLTGMFVIGLHVRHPWDKGHKTQGEEKCVRKLLVWYIFY